MSHLNIQRILLNQVKLQRSTTRLEIRCGLYLVASCVDLIQSSIPYSAVLRCDYYENQAASVARSLVDVCACGRDWIVVDTLRMRCIHTSISE